MWRGARCFWYIRPIILLSLVSFFFQAEDGIRDHCVTGVQTCALPISTSSPVTLAFEFGRAPPRAPGISSGTPQIAFPTVRALRGPSAQFRTGGAHTLQEIGRASCRERV